MIYITGDTHCNFRRFTKKERMHLPFELKENDYVIVCGDFGLLWINDGEFKYNLDWLSRLPFTLLWVQGNHENYNMIEEYQLEEWNGGKVRHIIRDKIILLDRGQVFNIEGKTFFTFGGASSHDVQGGILDKNASDYGDLRMKAIKSRLPYRVLNETWWKQELPNKEELEEGRRNLDKVGYKVDYVISHCLSSNMQEALERRFSGYSPLHRLYEDDILTDYFNEIEQKLDFKHWFCGHYHMEIDVGSLHTILYKNIVELEDYI